MVRDRGGAADAPAVAGDGPTPATQRLVDAACPPSLRAGARLGRYVVADRLGAGAMGVVYAAHDPSLNRPVAVKVVRAGADPGHLLDEARALARLTHPNVVPVYDAGLEGDVAYVVMARLDGGTLADWLRAAPRRWGEVVDRFVGAGRGLGAAHAAGVVHRDVKPGNVLLDAAGRPRVVDFGLARPAGTPGAPEGTPPYVAPEVWRGAPVDARSDQFAFAAAMLYALTGRLPAASRGGDGVPPGPPARGRVPRRLLVALQRGADADPARRWPDMAALLGALEGARGRQRPGARAALVGAAALLGGGAALAVAARRGGPEAGCRGEAARLEAVLESARRAAAALRAGGPPWVADAAERASARLGEYASAWRGAHRRACGRGDGKALAVRACLARDLDALASTFAAFDGGEPGAREQALRLLPGELTDRAASPARCEAEARPGESDETLALRRDLSIAETHYRFGRYREASDLARGALARARAAGLTAAEAAALYALGAVGVLDASFDRAAADLEAAFFAAERAGDDALAADAASMAVVARAHDARTWGEAARWARLAEARLDRLGEAPDSRRRAKLLHVRGQLAEQGGRFQESLALQGEALAMARRLYGDDGYETHTHLVAVAVGLSYVGRYGEALPLLDRALDSIERYLGPRHPEAVYVCLSQGFARQHLGRLAEAIAANEKGLDLGREALGDDHPLLAEVHNNLGELLRDAGRLDEARAHAERALAVREATAGPAHADVGLSLTTLGSVLRERGEFAEAERALGRARELLGRALPPGHADVARAWYESGRAAADAGRLGEAEERLRRAAELFAAAEGAYPVEPVEARARLALVRAKGRDARAPAAAADLEREAAAAAAVLGAEHAGLAWYLAALGEALAAAGRAADAAAALERAHALASSTEQPPRLAGEIALALAHAVAQTDPARARALAALAVERLERTPRAPALAAARRLLGRRARAPH